MTRSIRQPILRMNLMSLSLPTTRRANLLIRMLTVPPTPQNFPSSFVWGGIDSDFGDDGKSVVTTATARTGATVRTERTGTTATKASKKPKDVGSPSALVVPSSCVDGRIKSIRHGMICFPLLRIELCCSVICVICWVCLEICWIGW